MATSPLTLRDLNRATLARQMLLAREATTSLRALERLVPLQAQWPKPPFVALWSRIEGFARADLRRLLEGHDVVRATMMRGTLHLATAKDYATFRPALQPVLTAGMQAIVRARAQSFDVEALVAEARRFFGAPHTFGELRDHLSALHPGADERAMGYAVRMTLPLVMVPTDATWGFPADSQFIAADARIPAKPGAKDDPEETLVLRYLAALGPASAAEIQAWSGLRTLKGAIERLRPKLRVLTDERGKELLDVPKGPLPGGDAPAPVRFLPEFDNVIVSRTDERFLAKEHRKRVFLSALRVVPTVLIDGFVAATWKVTATKKLATLAVDPFAALTKNTREAVEAEGERLARFCEEGAPKIEVKIAKAR